MFTKEKFDGYESDLRAAVPGRYAKRADREVVSLVLIPQLRAVIEKALASIELPLGPRATDELCKRVDGVIHENRMLLDTDGMMKAMMPVVVEMRQQVRREIEENFKLKCREILAGHGVTDRMTLLAKGPKWFMKEKADFEPYGKGRAFASQILGRIIKYVTIAILEEIAEKVGFPRLTEGEKLAEYRRILKKHGITDRQSLRARGIIWFMRTDFEPYGKGNAFAGQILGRRIKDIIVAVLEKIADRVSLPQYSEETLAHYRSVLANYGITDRMTLLAKGIRWFMRTDFEPYGKGNAFAGQILGRRIKDIIVAVLEKIADRVGFPRLTEEETLAHYRSVLANHGITDRMTLRKKGTAWFIQADFESYGKGIAFAGQILGKSVRFVSVSALNEIADRLGW